MVDVQLSALNILHITANSSILKENYEVTLNNCVPRPEAGFFLRPKIKKGRIPWSLPRSLFKDYVPDTDVSSAEIALGTAAALLRGGLETHGQAPDEGRASSEVQSLPAEKLPAHVLPSILSSVVVRPINTTLPSAALRISSPSTSSHLATS